MLIKNTFLSTEHFQFCVSSFSDGGNGGNDWEGSTIGPEKRCSLTVSCIEGFMKNISSFVEQATMTVVSWEEVN